MDNPGRGADTPGAPQNVVFAASWIDLRLRFPPSSAGTRYLQWQGVKGAIWGTDSWSAESNGIPFPKSKRSHRVRKLNNYAQNGTVYVSTPKRVRYPSTYTLNGTEYVLAGNGAYLSKDGKVLDLRTIAG